MSGTTHIIWADLLQTVSQVREISFAANALADLVSSYESRGGHVSHILCGDFNIEPHFPAYQLLKDGRLSASEMEALKSVEYIRWAPDIEQPSQVKEVCDTAVFSVVTQLSCGVERCVTTLKTAVYQTKVKDEKG